MSRLEGVYPQSIGGTDRDETLRRNLVGYANDVMAEVNRRFRWSFDYMRSSFVTVNGTQTYSLASFYNIKSMYYMDVNNNPTFLGKYSRDELLPLYNEVVTGPPKQNTGSPIRFSFDEEFVTGGTIPSLGTGLSIELFPCPDLNGPTAPGNYTMVVEGYQVLPPIVESTGTTVAGNATLTVPSSVYLLLAGATTGSYISVRGAGTLQFAGVASTLLTSVVSLNPTPTTVTMADLAVAVVTAGQAFFNSRNWLITNFPKVLEFGVLREVANYLGDDAGYAKYEQRFEMEMEKAHEYDMQRGMLDEVHAVAVTGPRGNSLRQLDQPGDIEIRGG